MLNLSRLHVTVGILTREHPGTPPGAGGRAFRAFSEGGAELFPRPGRPPLPVTTVLGHAPEGSWHVGPDPTPGARRDPPAEGCRADRDMSPVSSECRELGCCRTRFGEGIYLLTDAV